MSLDRAGKPLSPAQRAHQPKFQAKAQSRDTRAKAAEGLRRAWARAVPAKRKAWAAAAARGRGKRDFLDRRGRLWTMKSKWEVAYAQDLDRQELTWDYEPHQLLLSDGRVYIPDFWVHEWHTYVEVKGFPDRLDKVELATADGHPVRLVGLTDHHASRDPKGLVVRSAEKLGSDPRSG